MSHFIIEHNENLLMRTMLGEINGYLRDHPDGKKSAEAKQRKDYAEKKIKEYEPLL